MRKLKKTGGKTSRFLVSLKKHARTLKRRENFRSMRKASSGKGRRPPFYALRKYAIFA